MGAKGQENVGGREIMRLYLGKRSDGDYEFGDKNISWDKERGFPFRSGYILE